MCALFCRGEFCFIYYLCCQSKTISDISSDKLFEDKSYYELIIIGIPSMLMNIISCHGFMRNTNSTDISVCRYLLVSYYLEKGLVIREYNSKNLISVPNDVKQIIHAIDKQKTDYVMACYISTSSVANTLNKLHIQ